MNGCSDKEKTPPEPPGTIAPKLTLANALTLSRLLLAPLLVWVILSGYWLGSLLIFFAAALSDFFDGRLARGRNEDTAFGGFFDHITDAIFVAAGCWALAHIGLLPFGLWIIILAAFAQYTLDSKALAGRSLRTSWLGRANGVAYFFVVLTGLLAMAMDSSSLRTTALLLGWMLVITTVLSMGDRAWHLWRHR